MSNLDYQSGAIELDDVVGAGLEAYDPEIHPAADEESSHNYHINSELSEADDEQVTWVECGLDDATGRPVGGAAAPFVALELAWLEVVEGLEAHGESWE